MSFTLEDIKQITNKNKPNKMTLEDVQRITSGKQYAPVSMQTTSISAGATRPKMADFKRLEYANQPLKTGTHAQKNAAQAFNTGSTFLQANPFVPLKMSPIIPKVPNQYLAGNLTAPQRPAVMPNTGYHLLSPAVKPKPKPVVAAKPEIPVNNAAFSQLNRWKTSMSADAFTQRTRTALQNGELTPYDFEAWMQETNASASLSPHIRPPYAPSSALENTVNRYLEQNQKLTKPQLDKAAELVDNFYNQNVIGKLDLNLERKLAPEIQRDFDKISQLSNKISTGGAITSGVLSTIGGAWAEQKKAENVRDALEKNPDDPRLQELYNDYAKRGVFQNAKTQHPFSYGVGQFAGETAKYATGAKIIGSLPLVGTGLAKAGTALSSGLKGKISAKTITNLLSGRVTDLPFDIINAAQNTNTPEEFAKELGTNQLIGFGTDAGIEAIGALWKAAKGSFKAAKSTLSDLSQRKLSPYTEFSPRNTKVSDNLDGFNQYISDSIAKKNTKKFFKLHSVSLEESQILAKKTGFNLEGYTHYVSDNDIRHILNQHGNAARELSRGQIPVTAEDIKKIPKIIEDANQITVGSISNSGRQSIKYTRLFEDGNIYYVEAVNESGKMLHTKTMWKKSISEVDARANGVPYYTVKPTPDKTYSTANSIPQSVQEINTFPIQTVTEEQHLYGKNTVGAAQSNPFSYSHLQNEFDTIKQGETPRIREPEVPKSTQKGNRVSLYARTAMEAPATPDELVKNFEDAVARGDFSHNPKKDKDALKMAVETVQYNGYQGALQRWGDVVEGRMPATKESVVMAQVLYAEAAKVGDTKLAMKLAAEIAVEGTQSGQALQSLRMLKKLTPEGQLYYAQKSIQKIQQDLLDRFKGSAPNIKLDEGLAGDLLKAGTKKEQEIVFDHILKNVADQLPSTWEDKWNAWRYLSMLGNARTHIRNIGSNILGIVPRKLKNIIKTPIEAVANKVSLARGNGGMERTVTLTGGLPFINRDLKQFAKEDFPEVQSLISGMGKYSDKSLIEQQKTAFKINGNWGKNADSNFLAKGTRKAGDVLMSGLDKLEKGNSKTLDMEDLLFSRGAYVDSFSQYMKANGLTPDYLKSGTQQAEEALERARKYAVDEAQRATFREANALASFISKAEQKNAATKILVGGFMPFKKTPLNIAKRSIAYSPVGLVKSLTYDLGQVAKGNITAGQAIDRIASGLSGSSIMMLGMWLYSKGFVTPSAPENKKERQFEDLIGGQNYALNIGGTGYTIDWAGPAVMPIFVGAELQKLLEEDGGEGTPEAIVNAASRITEPLFETTMLQGINSTIQAAASSDTSVISAMGTQMASNYLSQGVPSLMGQIARTVDPVRRAPYTTHIGLVGSLDKTFQRQMAKIPDLIPGNDPLQKFTSKGLQPHIDAWGRESEQKSIGQRAFENMLSPGYLSKTHLTPADELLQKLYQETGDASVLPSMAQKSFNIDSKTILLTAKQFTEMSKTRGETANRLVGAFGGNMDYQSMTNSQKADTVNDAYKYASQVAKMSVSDYTPDTWVLNAQEVAQTGISIDIFILNRRKYIDLKPIERGNQKESKSDQYAKILRADKTLNPQQKTTLYKMVTGNKKIPSFI